MMKKVNLMAVGGEPKPPNGVAAHGGLPTIVVSSDAGPEPLLGDAAMNNKGAASDRSDGARSPDKRKSEKKERERLEKLERKEQKKLEKEQKKSPKGGDGGKEIIAAAGGGKDASSSSSSSTSSSASTPSKDTTAKLADRFLGSKVAMEKFFKKKVKEREARKEKEKEERERERILLEELSASGDEGSGGDVAAATAAKYKKPKKKSKMMMGNGKIGIGKGYYSEGSNDDGLVDGRKKKRKTFASSGGSASSSSTSTSPSSSYTTPSPSTTPPDKDKDPMERETEREEEKEEETTDSDESSSSDDDSESEEEPAAAGGKGSLLHPNSGSNPLRQHRRKKDWTVSQEFRVLALETEEKQKPDFSFALQHKNRDKNRYGNALPNPETRVVLKGGDTDYINANYIQGEQTQYIAAQAPLPNTFSDFWLMVWEQNTRVIMMLTRLTENDRTKAEIYWPRKGPLGRARGGTSEDGDDDDAGWKQYGKMRVSLVKSTIQEGDEDVTIRHFRLRNDEEPDVERQVIQIHFTGWPDFGVPQNTKAFTQLLELMESFNQEPTITDSTEPNGPIVLHCSAGLGRTGTLIAAHIAAEKLKLQRVKSKEDIDMKAIVAHLREQRSGMVQTKCQYKFLHDLLNDL